MSAVLTDEFLRDSVAIHRLAMQSLFERLDSLCDTVLSGAPTLESDWHVRCTSESGNASTRLGDSRQRPRSFKMGRRTRCDQNINRSWRRFS